MGGYVRYREGVGANVCFAAKIVCKRCWEGQSSQDKVFFTPDEFNSSKQRLLKFLFLLKKVTVNRGTGGDLIVNYVDLFFITSQSVFESRKTIHMRVHLLRLV